MPAHALVDAVPRAPATGAAVLGALVAVTRQGRLSLPLAAALVADPRLLPLLCVATLPAWLIVTGRPAKQVRDTAEPARALPGRPGGHSVD